MIILGIDPGIAITGYALLECINDNIKIIASGSDWQRDIEPKLKKLCL